MPQDENPPDQPAKPSEFSETRIKSPYEQELRRRLPIATHFPVPPTDAEIQTESSHKLSTWEQVRIAMGLGIAVIPAAMVPPPPTPTVYVQPAQPKPIAAAETTLMHFGCQPLSDGEIDRLIKGLTPASPQKPVPEHFKFAKDFFSEISTILSEPGKFAADEAVSAVIHLAIEKAISQAKGKRAGSDSDSESAPSKNPFILAFSDTLICIGLCFEKHTPENFVGTIVLSIDELATFCGRSHEQIEATLTLVIRYPTKSITS